MRVLTLCYLHENLVKLAERNHQSSCHVPNPHSFADPAACPNTALDSERTINVRIPTTQNRTASEEQDMLHSADLAYWGYSPGVTMTPKNQNTATSWE